MKDKTIGFFGLGNMGLPICQVMVKNDYRIILPTYRSIRNPQRAAAVEEMLKRGAKGANSQLEMIQQCDLFMLCLPKSQQVEELILAEDGILKNAKPGTIIIDMTSADPRSTRYLSKRLEEVGMELLDCPVSGGVKVAPAQALTVMVGGKKEIFDVCLPILQTIGTPEKVIYVGPSGSGDLVKCANNFLSACCAAATTEAVAVCGKAGIDPRVAIDIIKFSGGMSHAATMKFPDIIFAGEKWNFALELMAKDIGLFNETAKAMEIPAFFGNTTAQVWNIPIAEAGGGEDCLHVQKTYEKWSGVKMCGINAE